MLLNSVPISGSGAAGLCLSGISLQDDVLARSEEQKLGLGAPGHPEAKNCLLIFTAEILQANPGRQGLAPSTCGAFPGLYFCGSWIQPASAAQLGSETELGTRKIHSKTAELQRGVQRASGEGSIYLQRVSKELLRSTS